MFSQTHTTAFKSADFASASGVGQSGVPAVTAPGWLSCLLNDVGFGVLILDPNLQLCFCNDAAHQALVAAGLQLLLKDQALMGPLDGALRSFEAAALTAVKGHRKLIILGSGDCEFAAAFSPIKMGEGIAEHGVLVTTERKTVCEAISLWSYGRAQGLTTTEIRVLERLADGAEPKSIADDFRVAMTTVRTHIKAILGKTQSANMRDLLLRVARLPPIRTLPCQCAS